MTLIEEEPQLFGAGPGRLTGFSVAVTAHPDNRFSVAVHGHPEMKRELQTLYVHVDEHQSVNHVLGRIVPTLLRVGHMSAVMCRRNLWALHDTLGRDGYEVEIRGCGQRNARARTH